MLSSRMRTACGNNQLGWGGRHTPQVDTPIYTTPPTPHPPHPPRGPPPPPVRTDYLSPYFVTIAFARALGSVPVVENIDVAVPSLTTSHCCFKAINIPDSTAINSVNLKPHHPDTFISNRWESVNCKLIN